MTQGEVSRIFWETLVEILENEKQKAIGLGDYEDALVAGFLEGLVKACFREILSSGYI